MAVAGSMKLDVLDKFKTRKFRTLIIDEENRLPRLKERLIKLMKGLDIKDNDLEICFIANQGFKFDYMTDIQRKQINDVLDDVKPDLVILDSMVRMMVGDENSSKDVRRIFDNIKSLNHGCAWLMLHHTRKSLINNKTGSDLRGSGDFMAMADEVIMVNRKSRNEFELSKSKCRDGDEVSVIGFTVYNMNDGICIENSFEEKPEVKLPIDAYVEMIDEWIDKNKIHEFRTKQCRDALKHIPYDSMSDALNKNKRIANRIRGVWVVK
jgi:hypothetical protein